MAKIDYWAIEEELADIIRANFDGYYVAVEEEAQFAAEQTPWVGIYLTRRTPTEGQPIAAGTRVRYALSISLLVFCFHLEKPQAVRDALGVIGELEVLLLNNRTINDQVDFVALNGGELQTGAVEGDIGGFISGGEILLTVEAVAVAGG